VLSAFGFALLVDRVLSRQFALEYIAGYGIEESLSIDNLFVFLVLFRAFALRPRQQRRVLFYGVTGAIVLRALMILAGLRLFEAFAWINYVFAAMLLYAAWHLFVETLRCPRGPHAERAPRPIAWLLRRMHADSARTPQARAQNGPGKFLLRVDGRLRATPLLVALLAIEAADVLFATDSVPAVLAVTRHPFVVYTSNIFAVLGLRSLYFSLAAALERLHKLRYGLAVILAYVGLKMLLARVYSPPIWVSLAFLALVVAATAIWSLVAAPPPPGPDRSR
jgi:tellurite resistance protein TerC